MGDPSDPILNCVTQVCCSPAQAQRSAAKAMVDAGLCDAKTAVGVAAWYEEYFDLLPKGTVNLTKVIELARQPREGDREDS